MPDDDAERGNPVLGSEYAYRALYERIRGGILNGQLPAGSRLPASRAMAAESGVSRNTVLAAFEQLHAEGYLEARRGSGTYVARVLPEQMLTAARPVQPPVELRPVHATLSARGRNVAATARMPLPSVSGAAADSTAFQIGLPAIDEFPSSLWARMYGTRMRESMRKVMRYDDAAGYRPLREAIAAHVATSRGIRCSPEQVVVVCGSQQALEFSARILLDPGDAAWMEDPGYLGARAALVSTGARIVPVPVDHQGLNVAAGVEREPNARLAIVTPSSQFPLVCTMSLERRLSLLEWANRTGAWVLEDDYDCEFRYVGRPLAALQAIDQYQRVIYVGTFSKVMFPGLRLGYLVAPRELVDAYVGAHLSTDMHPHLLDQAVVADFMQSNQFARHLRRMRVLYGSRQRVLVSEAQRIASRLRVASAPGGLHLVGWLPDHLDDAEVAAAAAKRDIHVWPLSLHCLEAVRPPALLLGYAGTQEHEIRSGIDVLGELLGLRSAD